MAKAKTKKRQYTGRHAGYLECFFNHTLHRKAVRVLKAKLLELKAKWGFEYMAYTGNSGGMMVPTLSYLTGIPFICVRKSGVSCHGLDVEGNPKAPCKYLIVDDLVASGATVASIISTLELYKHEPVGILLYKEWVRYDDVSEGNKHIEINGVNQHLPFVSVRDEIFGSPLAD
jgi:adenine/guanine phosphoribosyltransferase-like PRPP-binding protein